MSKINDLPDILDCFAAGLNYERTARRVGTSSRTIMRYVRRSYANDPAMICHWQDQDLQFIDHMKAARAMAKPLQIPAAMIAAAEAVPLTSSQRYLQELTDAFTDCWPKMNADDRVKFTTYILSKSEVRKAS